MIHLDTPKETKIMPTKPQAGIFIQVAGNGAAIVTD
jgi:hypothetical protein